MSLSTFVGLCLVTGGATVLGSLPLFFHHQIKQSSWNWWTSFCGGVMTSAAFFSLFLPAIELSRKIDRGHTHLFLGVGLGIGFIFLITNFIGRLTKNMVHQRAFLFVFVMGLHNIPEGLAVGVDVAALGWWESLPLTSAIFIQNLPEGLASSMSFLVAGFSLKKALFANGVTALIEVLSALGGVSFVSASVLKLPFLLSFSGACMVSAVVREFFLKLRIEGEKISYWGFGIGLFVCGALDLLL